MLLRAIHEVLDISQLASVFHEVLDISQLASVFLVNEFLFFRRSL
jgi:hypothetical protein